jgi:fermentation-respiration switch protein FrsA (DUF1100 family)
MCIAAAQSTGATVLAVDMPGTGEIANLPLGAEGDQVVLGVAQGGEAVGKRPRRATSRSPSVRTSRP